MANDEIWHLIHAERAALSANTLKRKPAPMNSL